MAHENHHNLSIIYVNKINNIITVYYRLCNNFKIIILSHRWTRIVFAIATNFRKS